MNLTQYPRPRNDTGLGVHWSPSTSFPGGERPTDWGYWLEETQAMGLKWAKVMAGGNSALDFCSFLIGNGIEPIVRIYRPEPNPGTMVNDDPFGRDSIELYVQRGVRYFEVNNEPNLLLEWKGPRNTEGVPVSWQSYNPYQPDVVADSWIQDADYIISKGGLPAIPAMSPGGNYDDMVFLKQFIKHVIDNHREGLFRQGVWISFHNAGLNHPLNYPFDDINQLGTQLTQAEYDAKAGEWAGSLDFVNEQRRTGRNANQKLLDPGASNCWNKGIAVGELFYSLLGYHIPCLGTEGGFWPNFLDDPRYHKISIYDVSYNTRLGFEAQMRGDNPVWLFCFCPWILFSRLGGGDMAWDKDAWFPIGPQQPIVQNLQEMVKIIKPLVVDESTIPAPIGILTDAEIAAICTSAGFSGHGCTTAIAIALAESGGDPLATNTVGNVPPSTDRGLFQINSHYHPEVTDDVAFNPTLAAKAVYLISYSGTDWSQWTTYQVGVYRNFWDRALAVTPAPIEVPTEEQFRNEAWNHPKSNAPIPYNPEHTFPKFARRSGLGAPLADEWNYRGYRMQQYVLGILVAPIDQWDKTRSIPW